MPRALATTSCEVQPAALSTTANPSRRGPADASRPGSPASPAIDVVVLGLLVLVGDGHVVADGPDVGQHVLDAAAGPHRGIGSEDQLGHALDAGLASDGRLQPRPGLAQ